MTTASRRLLPFGTLVVALAMTGCGSNVGDDPDDNPTQAGAKFVVDTSQCEDPAAATKVITGSWKVGYSLPLSGPVAGVVGYSMEGWKARIAAENAKGGINGVTIDVIYKDDAYTPDRAKANATEFLQSDHVDSMITFGTGPVGAIADDQNAACVPLLYPSSSVQQYRDIAEYPWTVQFLPASDAEARYDIRLIQQKFPNGAKVGIAENQTASGKGYSEAFQAAATGTNVEVVLVTPETDYNAAATQLKAANVDVVYNAGITNDCGPMVQAMSRVGFTPKLVINPSNCADANGYIAAGAAADGNAIPAFAKNVADPALADDPGVKDYLDHVTTPNKTNTIAIAGWLQADLLINTLKQAAASPDGLTHVSVIQAARDQLYGSPMFIDGIEWESSPDSLVGINAFQTTVWSASKQAFVTEGELISVGAN